MKIRPLLLASIVFLLPRCGDDVSSEEWYCGPAPMCSTPATMKDLTGLDGCGFVLELEDGTILEPYSDQASHQHPDDWVDGKKVMINYELDNDRGTYCMAGQVARITCISDFISSSQE